MPLAEPKKPRHLSPFGSRITQATRRVAKTVGERPLELMLILFLIANLFVSMKVLFGLFIILYFADKWNVRGLISEAIKPEVIIREAIKDIEPS